MTKVSKMMRAGHTRIKISKTCRQSVFLAGRPDTTAGRGTTGVPPAGAAALPVTVSDSVLSLTGET